MAENPSSPKQNGKAKKKKNRKEAKNTDEAYRTSVKNKVGQKVGSTSVASTSAGPPNPILDPFGDDKDFPDSEVVWENARRIDNPYNGLYFQEEIPAEVASDVMAGRVAEWYRVYQNKMIPSENCQGLEILSGQVQVLYKCVKRFESKDKEYRNKARREQILSLADECG